MVASVRLMILRVLLFICVALPAVGESHLTPMLPLPETEAANWPAIGRVFDPNDPGRGFCSGALVAPNLVLTAGHCSGGTASDDPDAQTVFLAGAFNSTVIARRRIVERIRHPDYRRSGQHSPQADIGLWKLDSPITDIAPFPLGRRQQDTLALLGYHRLAPFRLSGSTDCAVRDATPDLFVLGCRVISGNSGSPVLQLGPDGAELVGVVSSQSGGDAIAVSIGPWSRTNIAIHRSDAP